MKKLLLTTLALGVFILASQAQKHTVGEKFGGGIVFYLDSTGEHGLIAAEKDLPEKYNWYDAITNCENLELNGYSDWYLPNIEQLEKLRLNRHTVSGLKEDNIYWSSTTTEETDPPLLAKIVKIKRNGSGSTYKTEFGYVRAVRSF